MKKNPPPTRDHTVSFKLSPEEFQLLTYAASKSNARGPYAWMRDRLLDAARARLDDKVVNSILKGEATVSLLRESLTAARRAAGRSPAKVVDISARRKKR